MSEPTITPVAEQSSKPDHPQDLVQIDAPYFVPWGRPEMRRLLLRTAVLLALLVVLSVVTGVSAWLWFAVPLGLYTAVGILFFRNPRRPIPTEADVLVSPADGKVVEVPRVEEGEYLKGPAIRIGIFLSIFDVHVNRSPGPSEVEHLHYRPGHFHDARDVRCSRENESQSIGVRLLAPEGARGDRILVRQISGAIARRIICPLTAGDRLARGGLIGMIKYGSRTEIFVPVREGDRVLEGEDGATASDNAVWEPTVRPGDRVKGGESVVFRRASR